jgi:hypothetical protein
MKLRCPACRARLKAERPRQPCRRVKCPACAAEFGLWRDGYVGWMEPIPEGEWILELMKRSRN